MVVGRHLDVQEESADEGASLVLHNSQLVALPESSSDEAVPQNDRVLAAVFGCLVRDLELVGQGHECSHRPIATAIHPAGLVLCGQKKILRTLSPGLSFIAKILTLRT